MHGSKPMPGTEALDELVRLADHNYWRKAYDRMEAEGQRYRVALERISEWTWEPGWELHALEDLQKIAREALR
jgi:hypothetical protein